MAAFKGVKLTGRDQAVPVYTLVSGDVDTSGLRLSVNRYAGGIDLGGLGWSVRIVSGSSSDIEVLTPTVSDCWITFDWTFPAIVAANEGLTVFQLVAADADEGLLWQSGKYTIMVTEALPDDADYDEDDMSLFQTAISAATVKLNAMTAAANTKIAQIDAAVTSANTAVSNANSAKSSAETALTKANTSLSTVNAMSLQLTAKITEANTAISGANAAASSATSAASSATSAAGSATSAASAANAAAADIAARVAAGEFDGADAEVTSESVVEALGYTPANSTALAAKQDVINDLATIRSGAAAGATALQSHQDISGKQDKLIAGNGISIAADGKTISTNVAVTVANGMVTKINGLDIGSDWHTGGAASADASDVESLETQIGELATVSGGHVTDIKDTLPTIAGLNSAIDSVSGDVTALYSEKQDVISDLATIRSGAADGSEAKAAITHLTPVEAPTVGKVLKVKTVNTDGTFVCEWATVSGVGGAVTVEASNGNILIHGTSVTPTSTTGIFGTSKFGQCTFA